MKQLLVITFFIFCLFTQTFAAEDFYQFANQEQQQQFNQLTAELRCLVCQNQNLAESNAALAVDLRTQIYRQVQDGKSSKEIVNYLIARYGNFILYKPPLNLATAGLWFAPLLILLLGLAYLFYYLSKNKVNNS